MFMYFWCALETRNGIQYRSGWPWTHGNPSAPASQVLRIQAWDTMPVSSLELEVHAVVSHWCGCWEPNSWSPSWILTIHPVLCVHFLKLVSGLLVVVLCKAHGSFSSVYWIMNSQGKHRVSQCSHGCPSRRRTYFISILIGNLVL